MMQDLVGIVRDEREMQQALAGLQELNARAAQAGVTGHREYNTGWHTALDLGNLLTVSEAIARSAIERKESRGGHFRQDYPGEGSGLRDLQHRGAARRRTARCRSRACRFRRCRRSCKQVDRGEQMSGTTQATFRIWRGNARAGRRSSDYPTEVSEGMVVLDAVHRIQAEQAGDLAVRWNCKAGKCGSCSAEINGKPRLMCMTRLDTLDLPQPVTVEPMKAFPLIKDLVTDVSWNYRVKKGIKPFKPRQPDAADGTWRMQQREVDRVQEFRKCIECFLCQDVCHILRDHQLHDEFIGPRFLLYNAALEMHPLDTEDRLRSSRSKTASATATSPAAAPRCARSTSPSPRMRSFRSRSGWWIGSTIRSRGCCGCSNRSGLGTWGRVGRA